MVYLRMPLIKNARKVKFVDAKKTAFADENKNQQLSIYVSCHNYSNVKDMLKLDSSILRLLS